MTTGEIEETIRAYASSIGVPPQLAVALAMRESSLNPDAVGDAGRAIGLFQVHPAAAEDVGYSSADRYDVQSNIIIGISYLKQQYDRFGTWELALAAYKSGPTAIARGAAPPQGYVDSILASAGMVGSRIIEPRPGMPPSEVEPPEPPWRPLGGGLLLAENGTVGLVFIGLLALGAVVIATRD